FRLLEPLREYADEQLAGIERETAVRCHAEYYLRLGEEAEPSLSSSEQTATVRRLTPEMENFRVILLAGRYAEASVDPSTALRLAGAISRFWEARGSIREGTEFFIKLLALTEQSDSDPFPLFHLTRAKVLRSTGGLLCALGGYEKAHDYLTDALQSYQSLGDEIEAARTSMNLGNAGFYRGDLPFARACYERGLITARQQKDESLTARILSNLAMVVHNQGDLETALTLFEEALETSRKIKDDPGTANALLNLGALRFYREENSQAVQLFEECRALSQAIGHRSLYVRSIHNLGVASREQGDLKTAQSLLEESEQILQEAEDKYGLAAVWEDLGLLAAEQGNLTQALGLYTKSLKMRQENGERIGIASSLQNIALLAARQKKAKRAVPLLGAASALYETLGSPPSPQQKRLLTTTLPKLMSMLGDAVFTKLWEHGRSLTIDEAAAAALEQDERGLAGTGQ
ncbi:MAG: tetratricopeptide repeat protein, partial [Armatimonadota bacterium]